MLKAEVVFTCIFRFTTFAR